MEDFMKEGTKKMVRHEEQHHKTNYQGKHHAKAPYSSSQMSHAMDCYQAQGNGLGGHHKKLKCRNTMYMVKYCRLLMVIMM